MNYIAIMFIWMGTGHGGLSTLPITFPSLESCELMKPNVVSQLSKMYYASSTIGTSLVEGMCVTLPAVLK